MASSMQATQDSRRGRPGPAGSDPCSTQPWLLEAVFRSVGGSWPPFAEDTDVQQAYDPARASRRRSHLVSTAGKCELPPLYARVEVFDEVSGCWALGTAVEVGDSVATVVYDRDINDEGEATAEEEIDVMHQKWRYPRKRAAGPQGMGSTNGDDADCGVGGGASTPTPRSRKAACGVCSSCTRSDCNQCAYCLDMPKNGGTGRLRQKCKLRRCMEMALATDRGAQGFLGNDMMTGAGDENGVTGQDVLVQEQTVQQQQQQQQEQQQHLMMPDAKAPVPLMVPNKDGTLVPATASAQMLTRTSASQILYGDMSNIKRPRKQAWNASKPKPAAWSVRPSRPLRAKTQSCNVNSEWSAAPGFPEGWQVLISCRYNSDGTIRSDKYWQRSDGVRYRSLSEIKNANRSISLDMAKFRVGVEELVAQTKKNLSDTYPRNEGGITNEGAGVEEAGVAA